MINFPKRFFLYKVEISTFFQLLASFGVVFLQKREFSLVKPNTGKYRERERFTVDFIMKVTYRHESRNSYLFFYVNVNG